MILQVSDSGVSVTLDAYDTEPVIVEADMEGMCQRFMILRRFTVTGIV